MKRSALRGRLLNVTCEEPFDALRAIEGLPGVRDVALHGVEIHVLIDPAEQSPDGIAEALRRAGLPPREIRPIEPTLEDVFISLIGTAPEPVGAG